MNWALKAAISVAVALLFAALSLGLMLLTLGEAARFGENRAVSASVNDVLNAVCWRWCERL